MILTYLLGLWGIAALRMPSCKRWWHIFLNVTRFAISAKPSYYHRYYVLAVAAFWWLPASFLLNAERLMWFMPVWLAVCFWLWWRCAHYQIQGEYRNGIVSLNGRRGRLSTYSRVGPGFLLVVLEGDTWPPYWLFQDALPDTVYRRLSQLILHAEPSPL